MFRHGFMNSFCSGCGVLIHSDNSFLPFRKILRLCLFPLFLKFISDVCEISFYLLFLVPCGNSESLLILFRSTSPALIIYPIPFPFRYQKRILSNIPVPIGSYSSLRFSPAYILPPNCKHSLYRSRKIL